MATYRTAEDEAFSELKVCFVLLDMMESGEDRLTLMSLLGVQKRICEALIPVLEAQREI